MRKLKPTKISEIMVKNVYTAKPTDTLMRIKELLMKYGVNRLVITDDRKPVGIITRKDLISSVLEKVGDKSVDEVYAYEVMTKSLITVKPNESIRSGAKMMLDNGLSSLIVVDGGSLLGIITKTDLCRYYAEYFKGVFKVRDFMTKEVITANPKQSIFHVINLMNMHKISRVIVEDGGLPIGIVTTTDISLINAILNPLETIRVGRPVVLLTQRKGVIIQPTALSILTLTARDVMTSNVVTISEDENLTKAAKVMLEKRISGLPVIDGKGKLAGVITKTDITKAVASLPP